ncbi:hypothetical protein OIO90_003693 [Microbotryomycetes sp. JL221]|nr:hypothetical protein OIO90_003693 [Microbotryomycetes sp. JL221]
MSCEQCLQGTLHEGSPSGSINTIAGVPVYTAIPKKQDYDRKKAVLYLGDIFGFYENPKLLCDAFADRLNVAIYFPDYLNNDAVPREEMNKGTFNLAKWRETHGSKETRASLDPVIQELKSKHGVERFAAAGYCFGGKYVMELCNENVIVAGMAAHPAGIQVPQDLETFKSQSNTALLICACETDQTWPKESQDKAQEMLVSHGPGFKQVYYAGNKHGFAVRADISDPIQKQAKEDAFEQTVQWFSKYL